MTTTPRTELPPSITEDHGRGAGVGVEERVVAADDGELLIHNADDSRAAEVARVGSKRAVEGVGPCLDENGVIVLTLEGHILGEDDGLLNVGNSLPRAEAVAAIVAAGSNVKGRRGAAFFEPFQVEARAADAAN
jgi:hypothetical protein